MTNARVSMPGNSVVCELQKKRAAGASVVEPLQSCGFSGAYPNGSNHVVGVDEM